MSLKYSRKGHPMVDSTRGFSLPSQYAGYGTSVFARAGWWCIAHAGSTVTGLADAVVHALAGSTVYARAGAKVTAFPGSTVFAQKGASVARHAGSTVYELDDSGLSLIFPPEPGGAVN